MTLTNSLESRISRGKEAIRLAKERGMDISLWEDKLAKMEATALAQAQEVARRTRELLATRGWCLWQCSMLGGDIIAVVQDELVEGIPEGYQVYTEAELEELFWADVSEATLCLVHEAKKLAGAKVITGVTK